MSDFTDTAQHLAPRLALPASDVIGDRAPRAPVHERWGSAWTRLAAAGVVTAWLLSMGVFSAGAPLASVAPADAGHHPTGYFPELHRDASLTPTEQPATF